ncbi:unnamed protein product [Amoebophrya sp. A25]|nr:unnamed protein product [Amoebophrya sp. A25]|eukprot:GSA25T00007700001.1
MASSKRDPTRQSLKQFFEKYGEKTDLYAVLELDASEGAAACRPGAPAEAAAALEKKISKAYKKLSLVYHPDKQADKDSSMFVKIKEVCDLLLDPAVREEIHREELKRKAQRELLEKQSGERARLAKELEKREREAEARRQEAAEQSMFFNAAAAGMGRVSAKPGRDPSSQMGGSTSSSSVTKLSAELSKIRAANRAYIERKNEERRRFLRDDLDVRVKKETVKLRDARVIIHVKRAGDLVTSSRSSLRTPASGSDLLTNANKRQVISRIQQDFEQLVRDRKISGFEGTVFLFNDEQDVADGVSSAGVASTTVSSSKSAAGDQKQITTFCDLQFESRDKARQCVEFLLTEKATNKKFPFSWIGKKLPRLCDPGPELKANDLEKAAKRRRLFPRNIALSAQGDAFIQAGERDVRYSSFFEMEKDVLARIEKVIA